MITSAFKNRLLGLAMAAVMLPGAAFAFSIDDFDTVTDPADALFFCFDVVGPGNSPQGDLDQLDFGLAFTIDSGQMVFEFINASSISSVITQIYFDDSEQDLIGNGEVLSTEVSGELSFSIGGAVLPGGNSVGFNANSVLTASADSPAPKNGVGAGERLILGYGALVDPVDVGAALLDGTLRIGFHAQSIGAGGDSDAFVSKLYNPLPTPQVPVPEPATVVLLGMGATFLAARKRFGTG